MDDNLLSKQGGVEILRDEEYLIKRGFRVHRSEETAMRLVQKYTKIPVPEIFYTNYDPESVEKAKQTGLILMSYVEGVPLDQVWERFDNTAKEELCRQIWVLLEQLKQIRKPPELRRLFQCLADGSKTDDPLLAELHESEMKGLLEEDTAPFFEELVSDEAVRRRITERYYFYCGRRFTREEMMVMLPSSENSVFTHGDVAPRNIIIGDVKSRRIVGLIDWENAGWYPDYWEYANIMKLTLGTADWQRWMEKTAPQRYNLTGIKAARRVLL